MARTVRMSRGLRDARVADAEALWYDLGRWSAFVDGFGHVDSVQGEWPEVGSRIVWKSRPGGRGRVAERVVRYEPRVGQTTRVEDPDITGTQTVTFTPADDGCEIAVELEYELRQRGFGGGVTDLIFVRKAFKDSLRRTLRRFATELTAERELTG